MKKQKQSIDNAERRYVTLKIPKNFLYLILFVILFGFGFLLSYLFDNPLNESQFEIYEQVLRNVYKGEQGIFKLPEDVKVSITNSAIIVEPNNSEIRGKVTAKLENGGLVITRDTENTRALRENILFGVLFCMIGVLYVKMHHDINDQGKL